MHAEVSTFEPHLDAIDRCFGEKSVEAIIEALNKENTEWSKKTLKLLSRMSPTSLKVLFVLRVCGQTHKLHMSQSKVIM